MRKLTFLLSVVAILLLPRAAKGQTTFQKTYGPGTATCIKKTSDSNFIMTAGGLLKIDQNGNTIWHKTDSVSGGMDMNSIEETSDGGFIVGGTWASGPASKVALLKTDSNGSFQWAKTYGGTYYESGSEVKQTLDGGYVIVGSTASFGINFDDIYVIKTDSNGNLQWSKTITHSTNDGIDIGYSIVQSADSSYAVCGRVGNILTNSNDAGLIKLDKNGNLLWVKYYGDTFSDEGHSIISTSDGGYAISGYTESFGAGGSDVLLVKTDSDGALQWNISFGGTDYEYGRSVKQLTDGSYMVGGVTQSFGNGMVDLYLTKFDSNGIFYWTKTFGGTSYDHGYSFTETLDKGFISVGFTPSFGPGDIYVVKTDSAGYSGCHEFTPNMSMTFASVTVTTPSVIVSSPPTSVSSISFTSANVNTENTLCSLVSVVEVNDEPFDFDNAELKEIRNLLGQQVPKNLLEPAGLYIYTYYDNKRKTFGSRMQVSH